MAETMKMQVFAPKWNNIDIMTILCVDSGFSKLNSQLKYIVFDYRVLEPIPIYSDYIHT